MIAQDKEFRDLVKRMRAAQKAYFRNREGLQECKGLEALVDEALVEKGPTLFDPVAYKDSPWKEP